MDTAAARSYPAFSSLLLGLEQTKPNRTAASRKCCTTLFFSLLLTPVHSLASGWKQHPPIPLVTSRPLLKMGANCPPASLLPLPASTTSAENTMLIRRPIRRPQILLPKAPTSSIARERGLPLQSPAPEGVGARFRGLFSQSASPIRLNAPWRCDLLHDVILRVDKRSPMSQAGSPLIWGRVGGSDGQLGAQEMKRGHSFTDILIRNG